MSENLNRIFQQDNHFIIERPNEVNLNRFKPSKREEKIDYNINPVKRSVLKKVLNVNTRYRRNYGKTNSNNFIIDFPPIKNVVSLRVLDIKGSPSIDQLSDKYGSTQFFIDNSLIVIPNGTYTGQDLANYINYSIFHNPDPIGLLLEIADPVGLAITDSLGNKTPQFEIIYNETTTKFTIQKKDLTSNNFSLNFNVNLNNIKSNCKTDNTFLTNLNNIHSIHMSLGWTMGYKDIINNYNDNTIKYIDGIYDNSNSYTGNGIYKDLFSTYFLLSIDDFLNNHHDVFLSPFLNKADFDNNIIAKIDPHGTDANRNKEPIINPKRVYFGPCNLEKLHFKIYNEFGMLIDMNNEDYSITVELEVQYDS